MFSSELKRRWKQKVPDLPVRLPIPKLREKAYVFSSDRSRVQYNTSLLIGTLVSIFVDALFLYVPVLVGVCLKYDRYPIIFLTVFKSILDAVFMMHIVFMIHVAYPLPYSRKSGSELVTDDSLVVCRYLKYRYLIECCACLPYIQIFIWLHTNDVKKIMSRQTTILSLVLFQCILKLLCIFPLLFDIIKVKGGMTKRSWTGMLFYFVFIILVSHVTGAIWYNLSVQRQIGCWINECSKEKTSLGCDLKYFICGSLKEDSHGLWQNSTAVFRNCGPSKYSYGIFADAMTNNVLSSSFVKRYCYSLWWGLKNLSSYASNLTPTAYLEETSFSLFMSISGLIVVTYLLSNMLMYLQGMNKRNEEWSKEQTDVGLWMEHSGLPPSIRERVERYNEFKREETGNVDEDLVLSSMSNDLRRDVKRELYGDLIRKVDFFSKVNDLFLESVCGRLYLSPRIKDSVILREGEPVKEIIFIIRGKMESLMKNKGSTTIGSGEMVGDELLSWITKSTTVLPLSRKTITSVEDVLAVALTAEDFKAVASQFAKECPSVESGLVLVKIMEHHNLFPSTSQLVLAEVVDICEPKLLDLQMGAQIVYSKKCAKNSPRFNGFEHIVLKEEDLVCLMRTEDIQNLQLLNDGLLIQIVEDEEIVEVDSEKKRGRVVAVGPGVELSTTPGSFITFSNDAGDELNYDDDAKYRIIRSCDV